jgi:hypothetical protein
MEQAVLEDGDEAGLADEHVHELAEHQRRVVGRPVGGSRVSHIHVGPASPHRYACSHGFGDDAGLVFVADDAPICRT